MILGCTSASYKNQQETNSYEPFSILSLENKLVEIKYVVTGHTNSIPPTILRREDSYIYDLQFLISFGESNQRWKDPIYVLIEPLDKDVKIVRYDDELQQISENVYGEYVCQLEVKQRGEVIVILGYQEKSNIIIFDKTNPFRTKKLILN